MNKWLDSCKRQHTSISCLHHSHNHHSDVIMSAMVSQITGISTACLTGCSSVDQRKHQSSAPLAFLKGIHWRRVDSPHKGPVTQKMFTFDDVIMSTPPCEVTIYRNRPSRLWGLCYTFNQQPDWLMQLLNVAITTSSIECRPVVAWDPIY